MNDLISRKAAIDAIYETFCYAYCDNCEKEMNEDLCGDCHRKYQNWAASKKIISKTINSLPSAERHGKWIIRDNPGTEWYRITCSECGEDVTPTAPCIGFLPNAKVIWDYCPFCGARMNLEDEVEE